MCLSSSSSSASSSRTWFVDLPWNFDRPCGWREPLLLCACSLFLVRQALAIWPFFPQWWQSLSINLHLSGLCLPSQRKQDCCRRAPPSLGFCTEDTLLTVGGIRVSNCRAFLSAVSDAWASYLAFSNVRSGSVSSRRWIRGSLIPQTKRSRNMSLSVGPKSQCSDSFLNSEMKVEIDSPSCRVRE